MKALEFLSRRRGGIPVEVRRLCAFRSVYALDACVHCSRIARIRSLQETVRRKFKSLFWFFLFTVCLHSRRKREQFQFEVSYRTLGVLVVYFRFQPT